MKGLIQKNLLEDETSLIQIGYADETSYFDYRPQMPEPSAWINFPTKEDPKAKYKFISVEFSFSYDQTLIQRQTTYSLFEWMGDMGGQNSLPYCIDIETLIKLILMALEQFLLGLVDAFYILG